MPGFLTAIGALFGASGAAATAIGTGVAGAAGLGAVKLGQKQGKEDVSAPAPLPTPPSESRAAAIAKEETARRQRSISRGGRTVFTDPLGISKEQKSGLTLKSLTGV